MTDMIERVAKAIYEAQISDKVPDELWAICKGTSAFKPAFDSARAAIAAMREPTERMKEAGFWEGSASLNNYRAMIDAALECPVKPDVK